MKIYYIYKTINLINNHYYIGKHYDSLQDTYMGSGKIIKRAIKKYGKQNFYKEILEICTEENINEREKFWIKKLRNKNCYNIAEGGCGGNTMKHACPEKIEEWKRKIGISSKGKKKTPEQCKAISDRQVGLKRFIKNEKEIYCSLDDKRLLDGEWKTGHTKEHNLKNSLSNSGEKNGFYGKTHSKELKKSWIGVDRGNHKGKFRSEKTKEKMVCY